MDGSDVRPLTAGDVKMPVRDEREERLTRAGYLLVVGIDGFVRAVAALVWSIARSAMKHGMIWLQIGSPEAGGRET